MNDVLVTIICKVYNHEKYIRQTIESFVSQKTSFRFEVILHDDASTDGSAAIIKEYEKKYPKIIIAIYQSENTYSRGINSTREYILPIVNGKYIAVCEGDDCWIDNEKLQKQIDYMESHPECTFCFTNGIIENVQNGKRRLFIPYSKSDIPFIKKDGIYNVEEISKLSFIPTCSFLYPLKNHSAYPETYWEKGYSGDRKASLYATSLGYAYCLNDVCCCYHYAVPKSAMTKYKTKVQIAQIERSYINLNNRIDQFSNYKYSSCFHEDNLKRLKLIYCLQGNNRLLSDEELTTIRDNLSWSDQIKKVLLSLISDRQFNTLRSVKRKLFV